MPAPLKWNAPGLRWGQPGLKWNGLQPTTTQTRTRTMTTKAVIDFTSYVAAELPPVAVAIHDKMLANAVTFPSPPVAMTALATLISDYNQKLGNRTATRSADDILAFNLARHDMEGALHDLGVFVNLVAKGDGPIVEKSGFPSFSVGAGAGPSPSAIPAAPANLRLRNGDLPGSIVGRFKADRTNSFNVAQTTTGNPNDAAGWTTGAQFANGKFTISGLATGSTVWVRVATVGTGGVLGAWSDPAKIVVQ